MKLDTNPNIPNQANTYIPGKWQIIHYPNNHKAYLSLHGEKLNPLKPRCRENVCMSIPMYVPNKCNHDYEYNFRAMIFQCRSTGNNTLYCLWDSGIQRILFKKVQSVTNIRNMWFVTINFHIHNLLCKNQTTCVHDNISMIRHSGCPGLSLTNHKWRDFSCRKYP